MNLLSMVHASTNPKSMQVTEAIDMGLGHYTRILSHVSTCALHPTNSLQGMVQTGEKHYRGVWEIPNRHLKYLQRAPFQELQCVTLGEYVQSSLRSSFQLYMSKVSMPWFLLERGGLVRDKGNAFLGGRDCKEYKSFQTKGLGSSDPDGKWARHVDLFLKWLVVGMGQEDRF